MIILAYVLAVVLAGVAVCCLHGYWSGRSTIRHLLERIEEVATLRAIDNKVIWELRARRDSLLIANNTEVQRRRDAEASSLYWEVQAKVRGDHATTGSNSASAPIEEPVLGLRKKATRKTKQQRVSLPTLPN